MNRKLIIALTVIGSIALTAGIVNAAATVDVTSMFGTAGDIFRVDGAMKLNSVVIGAQDVGGVTFFNGTIVNDTTTNSVDNPVTFGDNVRIDGRVWRGAEAGTSDTMPFIVNDNMEVTGSLEVANLIGTDVVNSNNIMDDSITGGDISSTADLIVGTVTTTGDITQDADSEGALKGWAYVSSGGTLTTGYNATAATNTGDGRYEVTFNFDVNDGSGNATRAYIATPSGTGGAVAIRLIGAAPHSSDPNKVLVWTHDDAGLPANGVFMLAIY